MSARYSLNLLQVPLPGKQKPQRRQQHLMCDMYSRREAQAKSHTSQSNRQVR